MTPEALGRLSTLLDEALDLDEPSRESWLASLSGDAAALAPTLRKLLARQASRGTDYILDRPLRFDVPKDAAGSAKAFEPGDTMGPYRLLRSLGHGGMGEVWLADRADGTLKRKVALKLPHVSWAPGLAERFAREREILASLEHPNIARLYDAGFDPQGRPYMALEYVEGLPIDEFCKRRALPVEGRLRLLLQVANAVAFAHSRLVIHRDLKPGNILVTEDSQVRLLDFGIAKLMEQEATQETALTMIAGRALTLDYASPEQIRGEAIGTASDVYALGVVAFELLAGTRPYKLKRQSAAALEEAIAHAEVPLASEVADDPAAKKKLSGDLDAILNKALKKTVAERYPTADALAQDWRRHLEGQVVSARPDTLLYRLNRLLQRHRVPVTAAAVTVAAFGLALGAGATALVIFALLIGLGAAVWQARRAREQARIARNEAKVSAAVQEFVERIFRANSGDQADPIKARQRTAKELLDEGAARIEQELEDAPQAKLRVLTTLGAMYDDMGQLDAAIRLHARRAELAGRVDGPESSARLHALSDQISELASAERLPEAAKVLEQAAAIAARGGHGREALIAYYLAWARYARRTDPKQGLAPARQAVELLRQRPPSARLVFGLDLLGEILTFIGCYAEALVLLHEAADLAMQPGSLSNSTLFGTYAHLGDAHWNLRELPQAERAFRAAIDAALRYHGANSTALMIAHVNFAQFLDRCDRPRESREVYQSAVDILRAWPESEDKDSFVFSAFVSAAGVYARLGRLEEAMSLLDEATAAAVRHPPSARFAIRRHLRLAEVYMEVGDDDKARAELDGARLLIERNRENAGPTVDDEAAARTFLEMRRGRSDEVNAALAWWLAATGRTGTPPADDRLWIYLSCLSCCAQGELADARRLCEALGAELAKDRHTSNNAITEARACSAVGNLLLVHHDAKGAMAMLLAALQRLDAVLDPARSTASIPVLATLAEASLAGGDRVGAVGHLARAAAIGDRHDRLSPCYVAQLQRVRQLLAPGSPAEV